MACELNCPCPLTFAVNNWKAIAIGVGALVAIKLISANCKCCKKSCGAKKTEEKEEAAPATA